MDERTRKMIEYYIPGERDESLEDGEYYFKQCTSAGDRILRVWALDVLPHEDETEYGLYREIGGRFQPFDGRGDRDRNRGVRMSQLYDNKEDCRNDTHMLFDGWEELRRIQREAEKRDG